MEKYDGKFLKIIKKRKTVLGGTCNEKPKSTLESSDGPESDREQTPGKTNNERG